MLTPRGARPGSGVLPALGGSARAPPPAPLPVDTNEYVSVHAWSSAARIVIRYCRPSAVVTVSSTGRGGLMEYVLNGATGPACACSDAAPRTRTSLLLS